MNDKQTFESNEAQALLNNKKRRRRIIARCSIIVAIAIVVIIVGSMLILEHPHLRTNYTGNSALTRQDTDGSALFTSYAGPILPMSALGDTSTLTTQRELTFDFSGFENESDRIYDSTFYFGDIRVTDRYILTNPTASDQTVQLIYPFVGNFRELGRLRPSVISDGDALDTVLISGAYSGGFTGAGGDDDRAMNLRFPETWHSYVELLADGTYLQRALGNAPVLDQPVIVYTFTNLQADHSASINPSLAVSFQLDFSETTVLSYGFHAATFDPENNFMRQGFSIPRENNHHHGRVFKLIVVGNDITDIAVQGYANAGWHPGEERTDISADMRRYEAVLGDVLVELIDAFIEMAFPSLGVEASVSCDRMDAMLFRAVAELLKDHGVLSDHVAARYETGWLEDMIHEVYVMSRVFYLMAEVTVPAGESVEILAERIKPASFDFFVKGLHNSRVLGYDMMTSLGSALTFDAISASITGTESVEVVNQNFGFDPDNEVIKVTLTTDMPRYFLEVRFR
ncbi:MAG: hypothetical protein FWC75_04855 [Oscillospiraceae bacterium]|nr:hypothetical protein [Oscillospiraceae bacterium]